MFVFLGVSVRVFLEGVNIGIGRRSKADYSSQWG